MTEPDLLAFQVLARLLTDDKPLAERLQGTLQLLRSSIPFRVARVVVLQPPAWSLTLPDRPGAAWPARWTAELTRRREPVVRPSEQGSTYIGWPICWGGQQFALLELMLPATSFNPATTRLLDALTPLLAAAVAAPRELPPSRDNAAQLLLAAGRSRTLEELQRQLEAPLLLVPTVDAVLRWVVAHVPAAAVSMHIKPSGAGLLSFTPDIQGQQPGGGPAQLARRSGAAALAQTAIARLQPLWYRNGDGRECAIPVQTDGDVIGALVVAGDALRRSDIDLLAAATPIVGSALHRALVYQQMADDHQQLAQVFADLPTGLALTGHDRRLLHANPAWARLWGVGAGNVQPGQLIPWDMFQLLLERLPDPIAFDQFFRPGDGRINDAILTLREPYQLLRIIRIPIADPAGHANLELFVLSDVTREREAERAKTEFVSVVSHELRTPLTSILGYTELLLARDFAPAERFELLNTVWKQSTQLSNLVEDLLNVSRLDSGRITLNRWVLSIRQLVTELIAQLNKELNSQRHQLLLDIDPQLPPVYADRDRVRQILSNLLSNAIKYSPDGGEIVLRAEVLRSPPPGAPPLPSDPALLITVRDPGMGIEPYEQHRIFDRFYRVDNSNTRRIGGTGLGLSITKALIELHGGRIWVTSRPRHGSTFAFTLPLATDVIHTVQRR